MTKKVAIIYQGATYPGGIEQYLSSLFDLYNHNELDLTLISLGNWDFVQKIKNKKEKTIIVPFKWYRYDKIYELSKMIRENKYDLVVSQGLVANFYARLASFFAGVPSLVTVHSNFEYDFAPLKRTLYRVTDYLLRTLTKRYIVVSKYLKNEMVKDGVSSKKIKVIYNGVDDFGPKAKKANKTIVIGTIGRLHFTKGFHNLIHAIKLIEDHPVKLMIWGDGKEKEPLEELVKQHGLVGKVEFVGFALDISKAFRKIDIYIQPSLAEGFGLTVVEAMLAEKPVIVTPRGSLTELITDGKTGIVTGGVQPEAIATSLKILIDDKKFADELAKNARKEALEKFSVQGWIEETQKTYLEVAK